MKKILNYSYYFMIFCIGFLGLFFRIQPILWQRTLWYDEAFTGILLKAPFEQMNQMIFADVHPPLYYWLLRIWTLFFGTGPVGLRSFSLLFGMLLIGSVFYVGLKLYGRRVALIASFFTAISPFAIEYSQEARMYSLFAFLFVWSTYFFICALKKDKLRDWILWGFLAGLSYLTHYLALFFFILFYVSFVFYQRWINGEKWKDALFGIKQNNFWLGVLTIFIIFLTWIGVFIPHMLKGNLGWIPKTYLSVIPSTLQIFFFGHPPGTGGIPNSNEFRAIFNGESVGLLILILISCLYLYNWIKKHKRGENLVLIFLSLGTLIFLILLSKFNLKLYVARYFMPAAVLIYLLVAALLVEASRKKLILYKSILVYGALILMVVPPSYSIGWSEIYNARENLVPGESKIITFNPFEYTTARYYFGQDKVRFFNRNNPGEDFSGWVVVGNENQLNEAIRVRDYPGAVIIETECDWSLFGVELKEIGQYGELKACQVKESQ